MSNPERGLIKDEEKDSPPRPTNTTLPADEETSAKQATNYSNKRVKQENSVSSLLEKKKQLATRGKRTNKRFENTQANNTITAAATKTTNGVDEPGTTNVGVDSILSEKKRLATRGTTDPASVTSNTTRQAPATATTTLAKGESILMSGRKSRLATKGDGDDVAALSTAVSLGTTSSTCQENDSILSDKMRLTTRRTKMAAALAANNMATTTTSSSSQEGVSSSSILSEKRRIAARGAKRRAKTDSPFSASNNNNVLASEDELLLCEAQAAMVPVAVAVSDVLGNDAQEPSLVQGGDQDEFVSQHVPPDLATATVAVRSRGSIGKRVVSAFLLTDNRDESRVLVSAQPDNKRRRWIMIGGLVVVAIVMIILISYFTTRQNDAIQVPTSVPSSSPSASPSFSPGGLEALLVSRSLDGGQSLSGDESPQSRAMAWLSANPRLNEYSNSRIFQRYALATLYFALSGASWFKSNDWLSPEMDECDWFYTTAYPCNDEGELVDVNLKANFLRGSIPAEIALLSSLETIDLTGNLLSGEIPSAIGLLTNLRGLILSLNAMERRLPPELGRLRSLKILRLNSNLFSGTIPKELLGLGNITIFSIARNPRLEGLIPPEFYAGFLPHIHTVDIQATAIESSLPTEIGFLSSLVSVKVNDIKSFLGPIPSEIGLLSSNLVILDLSQRSASLNSELPTEVGLLTSLKSLDLSGLGLTGTVASEIGKCTSLASLDLSSNEFSGTIPRELSNAQRLTSMDLSGTSLSGSIPDAICGFEPEVLKADCLEVNCPCCTECCTEDAGCAPLTVTTDDESLV